MDFEIEALITKDDDANICQVDSVIAYKILKDKNLF